MAIRSITNNNNEEDEQFETVSACNKVKNMARKIKESSNSSFVDITVAAGGYAAKYNELQKIGEGSYSIVMKSRNLEKSIGSNVKVAVKKLKHSYRNKSQVENIPEVKTLRRLPSHPNILQMLETHFDPDTGLVCLVFELMEMNLYELIKDRKKMLSENRVRGMLFQLLRALRHLHRHGIFHRDVKPENILVQTGKERDIIKLADLGSVREKSSSPPYTEYISTRWYRSPECLLTSGRYNIKMDVWAAGCVFYEILTLRPLFPGTSEIDQINKIHNILGMPSDQILEKFACWSRHDGGRPMKVPKQERYDTIKSLLFGLRNNSRTTDTRLLSTRQSPFLKLLPVHITQGAHNLLRLMLEYDAELRPSCHRILQHEYFVEMRFPLSTSQIKESHVPMSHLQKQPPQSPLIDLPMPPLPITNMIYSSHNQIQLKNVENKSSITEKMEHTKIPKVIEKNKVNSFPNSHIDASRRAIKLKPAENLPETYSSHNQMPFQNVENKSSITKKMEHTKIAKVVEKNKVNLFPNSHIEASGRAKLKPVENIPEIYSSHNQMPFQNVEIKSSVIKKMEHTKIPKVVEKNKVNPFPISHIDASRRAIKLKALENFHNTDLIREPLNMPKPKEGRKSIPTRIDRPVNEFRQGDVNPKEVKGSKIPQIERTEAKNNMVQRTLTKYGLSQSNASHHPSNVDAMTKMRQKLHSNLNWMPPRNLENKSSTTKLSNGVEFTRKFVDRSKLNPSVIGRINETRRAMNLKLLAQMGNSYSHSIDQNAKTAPDMTKIPSKTSNPKLYSMFPAGRKTLPIRIGPLMNEVVRPKARAEVKGVKIPHTKSIGTKNSVLRRARVSDLKNATLYSSDEDAVSKMRQKFNALIVQRASKRRNELEKFHQEFEDAGDKYQYPYLR